MKLPHYDFESVWEETKKEPVWVHFGAGNLFRAYHAVIQQRLIEKGETDKGIIVVNTGSPTTIDQVLQPHDNLSLNVVMKTDGTFDTEVIASIAESIQANRDRASWERLKEVFRKSTLQLVTFTITEKGYSLKDLNGNIRKEIEQDILQGLNQPNHTMVMLTALLYERFKNGAKPIALVSTDNFSHNGDKLKEAVLTVATMWEQQEIVPSEFLTYINDQSKVSFPWSVIDKITPQPAAIVEEKLKEIGFTDANIIYREKRSPIAPFVNSEEAGYLVIEDSFPNGRPPLEKVGVYLTDKKTVDLIERMKVCTCLNPLHTSLAVFGCLLGYDTIAAEMQDKDLKALVERIGYDEGMKVVANPGIIDPEQFIKEVIEVRLPNPNIPDTPQRIATDTSQKLAIRFGETIKLYNERADLDVTQLTFIPLTIAAWCRYLLGINDKGEPMNLSPDPLLEELQTLLKDIKFGDCKTVQKRLLPILSNEKIFGVNLYDVGLGEKVEHFFRLLISGPGAVRITLQSMLIAVGK